MKLSASVLFALSLPFAVYSLGFQPTAYYLVIDVADIATSPTFNGSVKINLTISTDINDILLNAVDLNVSSVNVSMESEYDPQGWVPMGSNFTNNGTILHIFAQKPFPESNYKLDIVFQGRYQTTMAGFAKVSYKTNNTERFLGITNFEPSYARYVFPCVDEPNPLVMFNLDMITTLNQTVQSSVKPDVIDNGIDDQKVYKFTFNRKMSVYQLGWLVMDDNTFEVLVYNKTPNLYTRAPFPYSNYTNWATSVTAGLLDEVSKYTSNLPYPLDKLEQVVVPDFFVGATQSWGLISYSEEAFLVEASTSASPARVMHQVALGLAQQVLKQWFGDYVTMDSWKNSWLMNGFVEHLKFSIAGSIPTMSSWELTEHEVVELIQPALSMDTLTEITPLSKVDMYRGGALIRMLQNIIGDDLFKNAVGMYLNKKKGSDGNNPADLWNELYRAATAKDVDLSKQSIQTIMNGWTKTSGYPILYVTSNGTHFNISQQSNSDRYVPVSYLLQGRTDVANFWLHPGSNVIIPANGAKWILLNLNQTGYYRVNYHQSVQSQLLANFAQLPRTSRSQLIDDMFSLTISGNFTIVQLLQYTSVLKTETDYFPWYSALTNFQNLIDKFYGHSSYEQLKKFILDQMTTVVAKVGMDKKAQDSHTDILRRVMVLEKACAFGHRECIEKAVSIVKNWKAGTQFDADLYMGLICFGVANSSDDIWWDLASNNISAEPNVRSEVIKALTCTRNVQLLNTFLNGITSNTNLNINSKKKNIFLQTLSSTPFGADVLLNWLVEKLDKQSIDETTTLTPYISTTNTPAISSTTQILKSSETLSLERNEDLTSSEDYEEANIQKREINPSTDSLADEDIALILSLIMPKLTSINQGAKLDKLVAAKNNSGLSNSTLQLIQNVTVQVYAQDQWARNYNADIKTWLDSATTTAGVITNPSSTAAPTMIPTTGKPSSAITISYYSSLALTILVMVVHYCMPHLQISL